METLRPNLKSPAAARRRTVKVSDDDLVRQSPLLPGRPLPLLLQPSVGGIDLVEWAAGHAAEIDALLLEHRALLFRGFALNGSEPFRRFTEVTSDGELLDYRDRSSPRHEVSQKVYTSTDYPADQTIHMHHEGTYWMSYPRKIYFFCSIAPETGGETPIADGRRVLARIPAEAAERFAEKKVLYARNYNDGFGLTWQNVFQTDDPAEVEAYCRTHAIDFEWKPGGRLRTRQVRPAFVPHPVTGERLWFNHAAFFHVSSLEPHIRAGLLEELGEEGLPYNTWYGDGTPIPAEDLEAIRAAYREEMVQFPWQQGDLLLLDNLTIAHGRRPYTGAREILVGMAQPVARDDV